MFILISYIPTRVHVYFNFICYDIPWPYYYVGLLHVINDRIATQRYLTPEIPIGSRVMSRTTSAPTGGRARKVVAIIAGCRSFRTFRDCHASIAFTTVGAQPNLTRMFGQIWDRFEPKKN